MEWSFPWYALAVSSNNHLRVSQAGCGIQTITFNERVLSLDCHQVVVIRYQVILCQLELGSIQTAPEKGSEGWSRGQTSHLAPFLPQTGGLPLLCMRPHSHRHSIPRIHPCAGALVCSAVPGGEVTIKRKKKETWTLSEALTVTFAAGKL